MLLDDGSENGAEVGRLEEKIGDVIERSQGKTGVRNDTQVSGLCHWGMLVLVPGMQSE